MQPEDIKVPDLGSFTGVSVIEVLVKAGDSVEAETPLLTLETDKATMDVPSPKAGTVEAVLVARGDKVSTGSVIARLIPAASTTSATSAAPTATAATAAAPRTAAAQPTAPAVSAPKSAPAPAAPVASPAPVIERGPVAGTDRHAPVLVLGAGPGGYTAAFRAADLGLEVVLVERWSSLGGVCLNVGCIPSKALLHAARVIDEAESMAEHGIRFGAPQIDIDKLRAWKSGVVGKLTGGLNALARQRKVTVVHGDGRFVAPRVLEVAGKDGVQRIGFDHCIIAAGSEPVKLPFVPDDPRVMDSTGALDLKDLPKRLLVIGGGIIGLEMGCVYDALGTKVSVVELMDQLMPGADADLVRPLEKRLRKRFEALMLRTKVKAVEALPEGCASPSRARAHLRRRSMTACSSPSAASRTAR